jgi:hypothetical protein
MQNTRGRRRRRRRRRAGVAGSYKTLVFIRFLPSPFVFFFFFFFLCFFAYFSFEFLLCGKILSFFFIDYFCLGFWMDHPDSV